MADKVIGGLFILFVLVVLWFGFEVNHGDPGEACRVPIGELPPCTPEGP